MFFKIDQYFCSIFISFENAASHKYVIQSGRIMFRVISEPQIHTQIHVMNLKKNLNQFYM